MAPAPGSARNELPAAQLPAARKTLNDIRQVNALEMAVGKLAQDQGSSEDVKSFARELVEDHQNADKKVVEFATKHNLTLMPGKPSTASTAGTTGTEVPPVALDARSKKEVAKLHGLRGAKFDRAFASAMVKGHQEALDLIKSSKDKIDFEEFDSLMNDLQAAVEKHLDHAKKLQPGAAHSAMPSEDRAVQGRRPVRTPSPDPTRTMEPRMPAPPDPTRPTDPTRPSPDPTRAPTDPTGNPDPTRVPDPSRPDPSGSPVPNPVPTPSPTP